MRGLGLRQKALAALTLSALPMVAVAGLAGIEVPDSKQLVVRDWGGAPITLWYIRPRAARANAPVLFVMHGVGRDADRYLSQWRAIALRDRLIVAVPEFSEENFPGISSYNFGNVFDAENRLRPQAQWSYSAIEPLFDALRKHELLTTPRYWLFGHSAGAQFVHRFVMLGVARRMNGAISANSGSYLFPVDDVDWPFGLRSAPGANVAGGFATPVAVLLGDADTDPNHRSLPRQPAAVAQGPHRFARGQNFYATSRRVAQQARLPFHWSCMIVRGVGHDNGGMARSAVRIVKGRKLKQGADCAP